MQRSTRPSSSTQICWTPEGTWDGSRSPILSGIVDAVSEQEAEARKEQQQISTATNILLSKLDVKGIEFGNVINITFSSHNPKTAARVANDFPEAYIVDQLEAKFKATQKANEWLTEQLEELETEVVESERAVEIYREQHGLAEGTGNSLLDTQVSELSSQLIIARSELAEVTALRKDLKQLNQKLVGDNILTRYEGQSRMSLKGRTDLIIGSLWNTTSGPTGTYQRAYDEARASFGAVHSELRALHQRTQVLEDRLEKLGAPYTPGRMPVWEDAK